MASRRELLSGELRTSGRRIAEAAVVAGSIFLLAACRPSPSTDSAVSAGPEPADSGAGLPPVAAGSPDSIDDIDDEAGASSDEADPSTAPSPLALDPEKMRAEVGAAWIIALPPEWEPFASDLGTPRASRLKLTEDGKPLGPANSVHKVIRAEGGGAYSHWGAALYFSTSDGANPQTNGRLYRIEIIAPE